MFEERSHPLLGEPTVNIGVIRGGECPNIVPGKCIIQADRRRLPSQKEGEVLEEIKTILNELKEEIDHLEVRSVKIMEQTANFLHAPLDTDPQHPLVQMISKGAKQIGLDPSPTGATYWSDAALLANQGSIPSIVCGPGSIDQAHGANEYVSLDQLIQAVKLYLYTSIAACRKEKSKITNY